MTSQKTIKSRKRVGLQCDDSVDEDCKKSAVVTMRSDDEHTFRRGKMEWKPILATRSYDELGVVKCGYSRTSGHTYHNKVCELHDSRQTATVDGVSNQLVKP